jgi:protein-tyrosine-phosphatase
MKRADRKKNVLFLCTANSARSILSEAILNRISGVEYHAYSAGSRPGGAVNPYAIELLRSRGYATDDLRSKSWDEFAGSNAPVMNYIITVCNNAAGEVCPVWPGHPVTDHWDIRDPAGVGENEVERRQAFEAAYKTLEERIGAFVSRSSG